MLSLIWLKGLLTRRGGRMAGAIAGVALTVALLAALGAFISGSAASMTQRAIAAVPVDWQVQLAPRTDPATAQQAAAAATPITALAQVGYADTQGFAATVGGTTQTTGAGKAIGLDAQYRRLFPSQLRSLVGGLDGALVAQQTAANLHVTVGDSVTIQRVGLPPVDVQIVGVVEMPYADSFFQSVGVPAGTAPQAPPDNVLILPAAQWHQLFDPQAAARPDTVRTQLHVRIDHALPGDPGAAYIRVGRLARNAEARLAGSGIVGDNLAARLGGARADALYARVLFLFLGLPGAALGILLTLAVTASGGTRRRQEQALLRVRGAAAADLLRLAGIEALVVGSAGVFAGLLVALATIGVIAPAVAFSAGAPWIWFAGAASSGLLLALVAVLAPAWRDARHSTVAAARATIGRSRSPLWQRTYLDLILLLISGVTFWQVASTGYQVVLAPEGVPQTAVSYQAFIAPLLLWIGVGLLMLRLWSRGLARWPRPLASLLRPIARELSPLVAASFGRQSVRITRGVVLVGLALAFATSTAIFNTTYNAQSRVDAELTNGADVLVTGPTAAAVGDRLRTLQQLPGVVAAQTMQHRFAYVGNDLQDLYGIDPIHITEVTHLSNAFFANGNLQATLDTLAGQPDGVLVSEETVRDFQLRPGDKVNLRLQSAADNRYHVVPFRFVGIAREFPTAPKDSFLVANMRYIARQTGIATAESVLLRTNVAPATVAAAVQAAVSDLPGANVTDIGTTQRAISSTLTAVDLRALTGLELSFEVLLVSGATGLVLALGLAERRRTFAIMAALGARPRQLGAFVWSEGLLILLGGGVIGIATGVGVALMLVKLLTGVFDPPPEALTIPWLYLVLVTAAAAVSTGVALLTAQRTARRPVVESLRTS